MRKTFKIIKASPQRLQATIISSSPNIPISKFKLSTVRAPRQKGIPVALRQKISSEIKPGQAKQWPHAFLVRLKSGHLGLWTRHKTDKSLSGREAIVERFSLAVPQMIGTQAILPQVLRRAEERLDKELDHQVWFLLEGGNK